MKTLIGIDLGGTNIKMGLVRDGKVLGKKTIAAESAGGMKARLPLLEEAVDSLLDEYGGTLAGISLAFPGIVDVKACRVASTNAKYDDAPDLDLALWARRKWGVPFAIDNDARAAALGEWKCGAGKGVQNMVMMTIGTGIGTGAIVDGRPLHGRNFCAGSLGGHLIVDYKGRKCTCGNIGCAEAHGSSFFLERIIEDMPGLSDGFRSDSDKHNFKALFELFRQGDSDAAAVVSHCLDVWSAAIVNLEHAYDPEMVVIGGGVMKSSDIILPRLREKVNSLAWCPVKASIAASELGDDAAILASEFYF